MKGATGDPRAGKDQTPISIHAPVKGATVGADALGATNERISIHAPVKGATRWPVGCYPHC